jgi:hypothetical protein
LVSPDGTEAFAWLAEGVRIADTLDLTVVSGMPATITAAAARAQFGPPVSVTRDEWGVVHSMHRVRDQTFIVDEWEEYASPASSKHSRSRVRVLVSDPPFARALPISLRQLLADDRLESISIVSVGFSEPTVGLVVSAGRVESVVIAPAPDNNELQRTRPAQAMEPRR